jgi:hypothetical protein
MRQFSGQLTYNSEVNHRRRKLWWRGLQHSTPDRRSSFRHIAGLSTLNEAANLNRNIRTGAKHGVNYYTGVDQSRLSARLQRAAQAAEVLPTGLQSSPPGPEAASLLSRPVTDLASRLGARAVLRLPALLERSRANQLRSLPPLFQRAIFAVEDCGRLLTVERWSRASCRIERAISRRASLSRPDDEIRLGTAFNRMTEIGTSSRTRRAFIEHHVLARQIIAPRVVALDSKGETFFASRMKRRGGKGFTRMYRPSSAVPRGTADANVLSVRKAPAHARGQAVKTSMAAC